MEARYRYNHRPGRRRRTKVLIVLAITLVLGSIIGALIYYDLHKHNSQPVSGTAQTVIQVLDDPGNKLTVSEPGFTFELPSDWKETGRANNATEHSISWQATKKNEENRYLKVYIDIIPTTKPLNRLLPVTVTGNVLTIGNLSDNCSTFTTGGTFDTNKASLLKPSPARHEKVDFTCNLPGVIDNEVGTGTSEGMNTMTITGPAGGTHKYFFVFTDHNIQPNYTIFTDALHSFKAK